MINSQADNSHLGLRNVYDSNAQIKFCIIYSQTLEKKWLENTKTPVNNKQSQVNHVYQLIFFIDNKISRVKKN